MLLKNRLVLVFVTFMQHYLIVTRGQLESNNGQGQDYEADNVRLTVCPCPAAAPCRCGRFEDGQNDQFVQCPGSGFPELVDAQECSEDGILHIINSEYREIPSHAFEKLSRSLLVLANNKKLQTIRKFTFSGQPALEHIVLQNNGRLTTVEPGAFEDWTKELEDPHVHRSLSLIGINQFDQVFQADALKGCEYVENIILQNITGLTVTNPNFSIFKNVQMLLIHGVPLSDTDMESLPNELDVSALEQLTLQRTNITTIPSWILNSQRSAQLGIVDLSNNEKLRCENLCSIFPDSPGTGFLTHPVLMLRDMQIIGTCSIDGLSQNDSGGSEVSNVDLIEFLSGSEVANKICRQ